MRVKIPMTSRQNYEIIRVMTEEIGSSDKNGTAIGKYYSGNRPWCAEFVSSVYYKAGVPLDKGSFTSSIADDLPGEWMHRSAERLRDWFKSEGKYVERLSPGWFDCMPQPGDYAYIGRTGSDRTHAGIVEYCHPDGTLHTVEGNNAGRPVARYEYPLHKFNKLNCTANGIILGIGVRDESIIS